MCAAQLEIMQYRRNMADLESSLAEAEEVAIWEQRKFQALQSSMKRSPLRSPSSRSSAAARSAIVMGGSEGVGADALMLEIAELKAKILRLSADNEALIVLLKVQSI